MRIPRKDARFNIFGGNYLTRKCCDKYSGVQMFSVPFDIYLLKKRTRVLFIT